MNISVRKCTLDEKESVISIIDKAISKLNYSGSPQWSYDDKPLISDIVNNIENGNCYVLVLDDKIVATALISFKIEKAYNKLMYGKWDDLGSSYVSIHRFAVDIDYSGKGFAKLFLQLIMVICRENNIADIRIDTHPLNVAMQRVITRCDFEFKGIVNLPVSNGERFAYQAILE